MKLNAAQVQALKLMSREWAKAPVAPHVNTLLALRERELVEMKLHRPLVFTSYKSYSYVWRLTETGAEVVNTLSRQLPVATL